MTEHEESGVIDCPGCGSQMQRVAVDGIDVERCQRCGGVWLDALEKDRLIAASVGGKTEAPSKLQNVPKPKVMHCPKDKSRLIQMVDLQQPHVGFESCKICGGMFFDSGELKDLNQYSLTERVRSALNLH